jgi:hypothetical protein
MAAGSSSAAAALRRGVRAVVAIPLAPVLVVGALAARLDTARRRRAARRPRLVWGPVPIISIKYWSASLRARGYESRTCVSGHYPINERDDFDVYYDQFLPRGLVFDPLRGYAVFLWVLRHADVYLCFFDGGFLQGTALRGLELPLLHLAGKRIIVSPYGSDIAVPGYLGVAEARLLEDYPGIARSGDRVKRRVDHFARWASLVVRNYQYGYVPRWDVLWPTQIAIDTQQWSPQGAPGEGDGHNGEVVVVHAPNHRHIKGTDGLIAVVERLRGEGLQVRLELIEGRPNSEVRAAVLSSDIVAEQFIAGYALFAIEGMAAARPVLSALSWLAPEVREQLDQRCLPILDTDLGSLEANLRQLVEDPARRRALGAQGRQFVLAQHSFEGVGRVWDGLVEHVWQGTPLPAGLPAHGGC